MRPADVVTRAAGYLQRHGVDSPRATAELLLSSLLQLERAQIYTRSDELTPEQSRAFGRALCRRCSGVPTQHITGEQGFRRLELRVRPEVFVPRPETEVVVGVALNAIASIDRPIVADVGTGSGAIALAISHEHPGAEVFATDLSPQALTLAAENGSAAGLEVSLFRGDLLDPLPDAFRGRLDLVVSNPPYIRPGTPVPPEVAADPPLAVFGEPGIYARLFEQAFVWLRRGGSVVVEIEESSVGSMLELLRLTGFGSGRVTKDLSGRDRVVLATR